MCGEGTDCTALLCNEWMNKGKFWQNGETSSRRNDAYRSEMLEPRAEIITGCLKVVGKTAV